MTTRKLNLGDVCFLKGGSGSLTVIELLGDDVVNVMWFTDANEGRRAVLPEVSLMTVDEVDTQNRQHELMDTKPLKRCQ